MAVVCGTCLLYCPWNDFVVHFSSYCCFFFRRQSVTVFSFVLYSVSAQLCHTAYINGSESLASMMCSWSLAHWNAVRPIPRLRLLSGLSHRSFLGMYKLSMSASVIIVIIITILITSHIYHTYITHSLYRISYITYHITCITHISHFITYHHTLHATLTFKIKSD